MWEEVRAKGKLSRQLAEAAEGFQSGRRIIVCTGHGVGESLSQRTSDKSETLSWKEMEVSSLSFFISHTY